MAKPPIFSNRLCGRRGPFRPHKSTISGPETLLRSLKSVPWSTSWVGFGGGSQGGHAWGKFFWRVGYEVWEPIRMELKSSPSRAPGPACRGTAESKRFRGIPGLRAPPETHGAKCLGLERFRFRIKIHHTLQLVMFIVYVVGLLMLRNNAPGRKSGFRAGFRFGSSRASVNIGLPAGLGPVGGPLSRFSQVESGSDPET